MFCGRVCREKAFVMYHKYECVINEAITGVQDIVRSMRPFFYALYLFDDNIEDLKNFLMSRNNVKKTIFDYDLSDFNSRESQRNLLNCFDSIDAPDVIGVRKRFKYLFRCHPLLTVMWRSHHKFIMKYLKQQADIVRVVYKVLVKWPTNASDLLSERIQDNIDDVCSVQKAVGSGCFMFLSLINHSCIPNVHRHYNENNKMCLIVIRKIKKGEKLTVSLR